MQYWPNARPQLVDVVKEEWFNRLMLKVYPTQARRMSRFDILSRKGLLPETEQRQLRDDLQTAMVKELPLSFGLRRGIHELETWYPWPRIGATPTKGKCSEDISASLM